MHKNLTFVLCINGRKKKERKRWGKLTFQLVMESKGLDWS